MGDWLVRYTMNHSLFTTLYREAELEIEDGWEADCAPVQSFAAYRGESLLGAATLSRRFGRLILDYIAVKPEARGLGIGSCLVRYCLTYAGEQGENALWLAARTPAFFRALHAVETGGDTLLAECLSCADYRQGCEPLEMKFEIIQKGMKL